MLKTKLAWVSAGAVLAAASVLCLVYLLSIRAREEPKAAPQPMAGEPKGTAEASPPPTQSDPPTAHHAVKPATSHRPVDLSGLPNFHRVTQDLYRGAEPSLAGLRELKRMGIKTIVNLRWQTTDRERASRVGLAYEHVGIDGWHGDAGHIIQFLRIVTDKTRTPCFVYCMNGADRTGFVCAGYRVAVCGWSKADAIREMEDSKFGTDVVLKSFPQRIEEMDVDIVRREAGLAK